MWAECGAGPWVSCCAVDLGRWPIGEVCRALGKRPWASGLGRASLSKGLRGMGEGCGPWATALNRTHASSVSNRTHLSSASNRTPAPSSSNDTPTPLASKWTTTQSVTNRTNKKPVFNGMTVQSVSNGTPAPAAMCPKLPCGTRLPPPRANPTKSQAKICITSKNYSKEEVICFAVWQGCSHQ